MDSEFKCSECPNRTFRNSFILSRHYRNVHPTLHLPTIMDSSKLKFEKCKTNFKTRNNSIRHMMSVRDTEGSNIDLPQSRDKLQCVDCSTEYKNKNTLKLHKCLNHSTSVAFPSVSKNYKCTECSAEYTNNSNLKRHERLKHSSSVVKKITMISCSLCSSSFFTQKDDLYRHWKLDHAINIETEELEFKNKDCFFKWKNCLEIDTKSKFVRSIAGFSSKKGETLYYNCNRSGYFTSKSKGLRNLKTQGTCKMNSFCPARMKVRVHENGKHEVQFIKSHVGHGHDLGHISLTQQQREILAKKIASNVPFDEILNDVKESIGSDGMFGRIHLLTRKDLHNIKQSFNLFPNDSKEEVEDIIYDYDVVKEKNCEEASSAAEKEDQFILEQKNQEVEIIYEYDVMEEQNTLETSGSEDIIFEFIEMEDENSLETNSVVKKEDESYSQSISNLK